MHKHELAQVIQEKNAAWAALAQAETCCLAYQRSRATGEGYPELPEAWGERREELRAAYQDARGRYMRLARGR